MGVLVFPYHASESQSLPGVASTSSVAVIIVQVVDPAWLPTSGAEVTLKPLRAGAQSNRTRTDKDGYAKFLVPGDSDYAIEGIVRIQA